MTEKITPAEIIAELLVEPLMQAHREGRRQLYVWEAKGLAWLAASQPSSINAWTADCVDAYAKGEPILPGWDTMLYPIESFADRLAE